MPHNVTPPEKPGRAAPCRDVFSFDRAALVTLGFYEPGKPATLNDPAFTGARFPKAVVAHEMTHQSLMINTTFGLFTHMINLLRSRGFVGDDVYASCYEVQWTVQEAAATYGELAVIAREAPAELAREIDALPRSARSGQPPYREAFETIASRLPLDTGDDEGTIRAKAMLAHLLAFAAMNTDCLRRALADAPSDEVLLACMVDTPDDRFERLLAALGKCDAFSSLLGFVRRHVVDTGGTAAGFSLSFYEKLRPLAENAISWEEEDFKEAHARLVAFWRPWLNNVEFRSVSEDPLPKVAYGSERARVEMQRRPPQPLPEGAIADFAAKAARLKQGIIIELALRDPRLVHAKLGTYVPAVQDEPWPGEASDEQSAAISPDIRGLARPEILLRELKAYPTLPRVVSLLLPGGIRHFAKVPGSGALLRGAIRVYRLTDISLDDVEEAVRESGGREFLVLRLSPKLLLGCILQKGEEAFVIARTTSAVAVDLFVSICTKLGISQAQDPDSLHRERDLLSMIGRF